MQRHITLDLTEGEFNELRAFLNEGAGMSLKEVLTDLICMEGRNHFAGAFVMGQFN